MTPLVWKWDLFAKLDFAEKGKLRKPNLFETGFWGLSLFAKILESDLKGIPHRLHGKRSQNRLG